MRMLYRQRTLDTPHGQVETPILFPVRNVGKRSTDNTPEYTDRIPELQTAMVNTRAIRNREPQWDRVKRGASLREEMNVAADTILYADSGGFDFQSAQIDTTPEETLTTQRAINADILGTVDQPLSPRRPNTENQATVKQNIDYALQTARLHDEDSLLFASIHGYDPETVRNSIQYLEKRREFDGYALGSLVPIQGRLQKVTKLILAARRTTEKHLHVYGLGGFVHQPLLLYLGVDSFDSTSFIRDASNRRYLVPGFRGEVIRELEDMDYLPCPCPVCGTTPLALVRQERELLTRHNLWAMMTELRRFRYIAESDRDIEEYLALRFAGNDVVNRAYQIAKQQVRRLA